MARRNYNNENNRLAGRPFKLHFRYSFQDSINRFSRGLNITTEELYRRFDRLADVITPPEGFNEACNRAMEELIRRLY